MMKEIGCLLGVELRPETMIDPREIWSKEFIELLRVPYDPYVEGVYEGKTTVEYMYSKFGDPNIRHRWTSVGRSRMGMDQVHCFHYCIFGKHDFLEKEGTIDIR